MFAAYLSSAAGDATQFTMYKRPTTNTCSNLTVNLPSVIQCAGHCKLNRECSGFKYNETNGDCVMSCCANPQHLEEALGGEEDVIYAETTPNHLLARGIACMCVYPFGKCFFCCLFNLFPSNLFFVGSQLQPLHA